MRRVLLLALFWGLVSSGCQNEDPIKIGFVGGITGTNASIAISGRNAVLLAVDEVNRAGGIYGRPVTLVIKDDQENPEVAAAADRAFIEEEVPVVIGHYISAVAAASLAATQDQDILMISPTISARELSNKDDNFLRIILTNTAQGKVLADYSAEVTKNKRSYFVYNDGNKPFVEGVTEAYRTNFEANGGQVAGEARIASQDTAGMNAAIQEAIREGADSFLVVMNASDVAMFAQQLKKTGMKHPIYSATWGMASDVIFQGGSAVEGIVFSALFDASDKSPDFMRFKETYEKLYGESVDFAAVYSYETAQMIFEALETADPEDAEAIRKTILKIGTFQGLQAPIIMDAYGDVSRPQFITAIKGGKFVTIGQVE